MTSVYKYTSSHQEELTNLVASIQSSQWKVPFLQMLAMFGVPNRAEAIDGAIKIGDLYKLVGNDHQAKLKELFTRAVGKISAKQAEIDIMERVAIAEQILAHPPIQFKDHETYSISSAPPVLLAAGNLVVICSTAPDVLALPNFKETEKFKSLSTSIDSQLKTIDKVFGEAKLNIAHEILTGNDYLRLAARDCRNLEITLGVVKDLAAYTLQTLQSV